MRTMNRILIVVVVGLLLVGGLPAHAQTSNAQRNKKAYTDALDQLSKGKPDAYYHLYPDHFQSNGHDVTRKDTEEATGNAFLAAIPDLQLVPDVVIAQDDLVASAVIYSGTFSQPLSFALLGPNPIAPTNKRVTWMETDLMRFDANGQIVELWIGGNPIVMLTQLGIIPAQPADPNDPVKYLTDPVGFKALKPTEQAATFTSGMEKRNLTNFAKGSALPIGADVSAFFTNPYISRGEGPNPQAETTDPNPFIVGVLLKAMPDVKLTDSSVLAEGDWVASVVTITGTFTGAVQTGPTTLNPTGKAITWGAVAIYRFDAAGKVTETWSVGDATPLLMGLGMMPSPPAGAGATPAK